MEQYEVRHVKTEPHQWMPQENLENQLPQEKLEMNSPQEKLKMNLPVAIQRHLALAIAVPAALMMLVVVEVV
ncbi:zinc finger family protein [Corchorus olitorius]|uniref:Zinc finger family protein n=1 Tax=Corchorus olitorius TaxID=93759 RepID=A0A1R3IWA9_9ROSI|nr:zinc finger family protein [Corchorus olitorius]